ncbi:hypothetical protein EGH24_13815 [Halonotius terrestris]|uniref:Uncharacterized protein n=1 Tax=Halonotius terrestris TaxID=2487750 RepID=A0A8J8TBA5_9EURY|nr:hypothetical protein [Halonotius terrestris]TQQ78594.1 hypothetical protein EGH24_13815 [Halonotius terrestris]
MSILQNDPDMEAQLERQQEMEAEREARQTASQLASQAAMEQGTARDGYWDVIGQPDIGREGDDDELQPFLQTEFSRAFALGNISRKQWQKWQWQIESEFFVIKNEFHDAESRLGDDDLRIMYGEERPRLTNEKARRLRSAMQVKKLMSSLSVDSRGLRSGTEIHAVARHEDSNDDEEDDSRTGRLRSWLSG